MSHLLDVNFLLACAWSGHAGHARANRWLNSASTFATAPLTQMGFPAGEHEPGLRCFVGRCKDGLERHPSLKVPIWHLKDRARAPLEMPTPQSR